MIRRSWVVALVAWVLLAWSASACMRSFAARCGGAALLPEPAFAFLSLAALRAPLVVTSCLAYVLGSEAAHASAAPPGVVEASYVWAAALVAWGRARWLRRGPRDVALSAAAMSLLVQLGLAALALLMGRPVGFHSWAAALLLPGALVNGLFALAVFSPLHMLWQRLTLAHSERSIAFPKR